MERIKLNLPEKFHFSTFIPVRITDLNYGGHVGNDVFMSLIHEARMQFLIHHGYTESNFAGVGLIMANAAIEYKQELLYGHTVKISVTANGFDKIGFDIFYLMEIVNNDTLQLAGKVKTGMMCYNYKEKKRVSVPAEAIEKFANS